MGESQTEWENQESQWQVEHEEEVRALRQRNSQLFKLLEDTRTQYQEYIEDQEREVYSSNRVSSNTAVYIATLSLVLDLLFPYLQNSMLIRDLTNKQGSLERELELRMQELDPTSPREDDTSDEREVLLDIIQQLCQELQKPLCI